MSYLPENHSRKNLYKFNNSYLKELNLIRKELNLVKITDGNSSEDNSVCIPSSSESIPNQELYEFNHDYLENLNLIRKQLNLDEIRNNRESSGEDILKNSGTTNSSPERYENKVTLSNDNCFVQNHSKRSVKFQSRIRNKKKKNKIETIKKKISQDNQICRVEIEPKTFVKFYNHKFDCDNTNTTVSGHSSSSGDEIRVDDGDIDEEWQKDKCNKYKRNKEIFQDGHLSSIYPAKNLHKNTVKEKVDLHPNVVKSTVICNKYSSNSSKLTTCSANVIGVHKESSKAQNSSVISGSSKKSKAIVKSLGITLKTSQNLINSVADVEDIDERLDVNFDDENENVNQKKICKGLDNYVDLFNKISVAVEEKQLSDFYDKKIAANTWLTSSLELPRKSNETYNFPSISQITKWAPICNEKANANKIFSYSKNSRIDRNNSEEIGDTPFTRKNYVWCYPLEMKQEIDSDEIETAMSLSSMYRHRGKQRVDMSYYDMGTSSSSSKGDESASDESDDVQGCTRCLTYFCFNKKQKNYFT